MKKLLYALMFVPMLFAGCDNGVSGDEGKGDGGNGGNGGNKPASDFSVDVTVVNVAAEGETFDVTVTSAYSYEVLSSESWITELTMSPFAARPNTHTFRAARNSSGAIREGEIWFRNEKDDYLTVKVNQGMTPPSSNEVEGDWREYEFFHYSLYLEFTGTWCGFCPMMAQSIERVQKLYPNTFHCIPMHDSQSTLAFDATSYYVSLYKIGGFPKGLVDGRVRLDNKDYTVDMDNSIINALKESWDNYPTVTGAAISSKLEGYNLTVDCTVYFKTPANYKVYAMVLESDIYTTQTSYTSGTGGVLENYLNDHVGRAMLTGNNGTSLRVLDNTGEEHKWTWTKNIDSSWNQDNLEILVWVEREFGDLPRLQTDSFGNYFVDNCAIAKLGENYTLKVR